MGLCVFRHRMVDAINSGVGDWYHAYVRGDKDGFVRFQASDG